MTLFRGTRAPIDLGGHDLVRRDGPCFEAALPVDGAAVAASLAPALHQALREHGYALIRGLRLDGAAGFVAFAGAVTPELCSGYPELPRLADGSLCHRATPYPSELAIRFHNEAAHRGRWPRHQWFLAETVAEEGGRTLLVDGRQVLAALRPPLRAELERRGLRYLRRFAAGLDIDAAAFAGAADPEAIDAALRAEGAEVARDPELRISMPRPALIPHPDTGEPLPFHQLFVHHASRLPPALQGAGAPRHAVWGDGAEIDDAVVDELEEVYHRLATPVAWRAGDLLFVDNVRQAHSREPFRGARRVLVALAGQTC